jgi:hypothetical protein
MTDFSGPDSFYENGMTLAAIAPLTSNTAWTRSKNAWGSSRDPR